MVVSEDQRERRLNSASVPESITKIQDVVLEDCRLSKRDLIEALEFSLDGVSDILAEFSDFIKRFKQDEKDFTRRLPTVNKTWVYHHEPKSKQG